MQQRIMSISAIITLLTIGSLAAITTPLHDAAARGCVDEFFSIYAQQPDWLAEQDDAGNTPLHIAALMGHECLLRACIERTIWVECLNKKGFLVSTCIGIIKLKNNIRNNDECDLGFVQYSLGLIDALVAVWGSALEQDGLASGILKNLAENQEFIEKTIISNAQESSIHYDLALLKKIVVQTQNEVQIYIDMDNQWILNEDARKACEARRNLQIAGGVAMGWCVLACLLSKVAG